jgi:hypothetical protein
MDPLSEVLSLLKLQTYVSGGFGVEAGTGLEFPRHKGIKCYAVISNSCWVAIEGVPDAVRLKAGDCFILPRGLPFCVATDLSGPRARSIPELLGQFSLSRDPSPPRTTRKSYGPRVPHGTMVAT